MPHFSGTLPRMRITGGAATISFTPGKYRRPDRFLEIRNVAINGTRSIYTRATTLEFHEVEVVFATSGVASVFNALANSHATITFTYDLGGSGSTAITARLINESRPMQMWDELWDERYTGTMLVEEIR